MAQDARVKEGWLGPGRGDGTITPMPREDDGVHIDPSGKGSYEWWYFDAHLEGGYTIVAFFYAANPNPGATGKTGVELTLLRPDGRKTQRFVEYPHSEFRASREKADVSIGGNRLESDWTGPLPVYRIHLEEAGMAFDLTYASQVNPWKPGSGMSSFADMGYFAWVVPIPRAAVGGTIRDGDRTLEVKGVGYHDHNWLNFPFQRLIEHWMWGRVYSENYTVSYALIQCSESVGRHAIKVLMVARKENVILSTGDYELRPRDFDYSPSAGHSYPRTLAFAMPNGFRLEMKVRKVLEAVNMLDNFSAALRFAARYLLRMKPGYFRLLSDFRLEAEGNVETGTALHEIVAFKAITSPQP